MRSTIDRFSLLIALLALLTAACADSAASSGGPGDSGSDAGSDTGSDSGSDSGDDQGGDDQGGQDVADDSLVIDLGNEDAGGTECSVDISGLSFPNTYGDGDGGTRQVRLIIEAVDYDNDIVHIRNVTGETGISGSIIDFDDDWRVAINAGNQASLQAASDLPAGAQMRLHLTASGANSARDTYLGVTTLDIHPCGGEVVIQDRSAQQGLEWSNNPGNIEAFVRWGRRHTPGSTSTFTDEAFDAGAWTVDWTAPTDEASASTCWSTPDVDICTAASATCDVDDPAIMAVGDVTDPADWESTSSADFVGCP